MVFRTLCVVSMDFFNRLCHIVVYVQTVNFECSCSLLQFIHVSVYNYMTSRFLCQKDISFLFEKDLNSIFMKKLQLCDHRLYRAVSTKSNRSPRFSTP